MSTDISIFISHLIYKGIGWIPFSRRIEWKKMLEYLEPQKGDKLLDVACGDGTFSLKLAEKGIDVTGIDLSKKSIEAAKKISHREGIECEFVEGDAENMQLSSNHFDKIVCSSSLEHFKNDQKALKEMNRVLTDEGSIVITVDSLSYPISDFKKSKHQKQCSVVNYYDKIKLENSFENAGFELVKNDYILNSYITSKFFNYLYIDNYEDVRNGPGIKWNIISLIAYPLCRISDSLFGKKNCGYTLISKGIKK